MHNCIVFVENTPLQLLTRLSAWVFSMITILSANHPWYILWAYSVFHQNNKNNSKAYSILEKIFKSFYHIWAWWPPWSMNCHHFSNLLFPKPKGAPYLIWAKLAHLLQSCLKMLMDRRKDGQLDGQWTKSDHYSSSWAKLRWAGNYQPIWTGPFRKNLYSFFTILYDAGFPPCLIHVPLIKLTLITEA